MKKALVYWVNQEESRQKKSPPLLDPLMGELIGSRFMQALGIGAPFVELISESESGQRSRAGWILKPSGSGGLIAAIRKVPRAISLFFLRTVHGLHAEPSQWKWSQEPIGALLADLPQHIMGLKEPYDAIGRVCPEVHWCHLK
ncbi:MAG TPA: hypothetical protein VOA41_17755 [Candidatus Dormibacteraeota bacterium]|nr:hypothetical protein [Candidatus Dormibacteraeota bacterium]